MEGVSWLWIVRLGPAALALDQVAVQDEGLGVVEAALEQAQNVGGRRREERPAAAPEVGHGEVEGHVQDGAGEHLLARLVVGRNVGVAGEAADSDGVLVEDWQVVGEAAVDVLDALVGGHPAARPDWNTVEGLSGI